MSKANYNTDGDFAIEYVKRLDIALSWLGKAPTKKKEAESDKVIERIAVAVGKDTDAILLRKQYKLSMIGR